MSKSDLHETYRGRCYGVVLINVDIKGLVVVEDLQRQVVLSLDPLSLGLLVLDVFFFNLVNEILRNFNVG